MNSHVAPFHTLRLRAAGLLGRLLAAALVLRDRLPAADTRTPRPHDIDTRVPSPRDGSVLARVGPGAATDAKPSTAPQDLYRIWICMKSRTDGRPCCAQDVTKPEKPAESAGLREAQGTIGVLC